MYYTRIYTFSSFTLLEWAERPQTWVGDRVFIDVSYGIKILMFFKNAGFSIAVYCSL